MYFTQQPKDVLKRLMNHTLDHFTIDIGLGAVRITYKEKTCDVFSESVQRIYSKAFEEYQEETKRYQEALHVYEEIEQGYLLEKGVTAEELSYHQELVKSANPTEYTVWYEKVILNIIKDDKENFENAIKHIIE